MGRIVKTFWAVLVFNLLFVLLFPFLLIPIVFSSQHRLTGIINRIWARAFFVLAFIPFDVEYRAPLNPAKKYIFCPNHFSYLDIPTMGLNKINTVFVGKNDMERVPLFGFMYRRLHITVNRSSLRSRGETMLKSMKAIEEGKSLIIYPEGGMVANNPPQMKPFKDGAFRTAIEKQIAIVPVTIPFNWIILPDQKTLRLQHGRMKVIFHEPIETTGMDVSRIDELKQQVYNVIHIELQKQNDILNSDKNES
ncbi:MAG: 1-acyl-sn-glycerol-3-phosphate acyltransferase [Bacteroidetes bacterium]|nr:1-acyl-sn-glycerol-3-phosphate acyltransferase [Bacteroidota bacterium]MBS1540263.1 1-acyl-sn-glycerol-3-phosphate acyltransferase [Bacteroidota bacterium]